LVPTKLSRDDVVGTWVSCFRCRFQVKVCISDRIRTLTHTSKRHMHGRMGAGMFEREKNWLDRKL